LTNHKCYMQGVCPSGRPFVGLHTSPIDLCSAPARFFTMVYSRLPLPLCRLDKKRRRRETCSAMLRVLTITPFAPAPSIVAFLLLCVPLRRRWSPTLLLLLLYCAAPLLPTATSALQPTLPDGTGTAAPVRATEAATQGKALGPGVESL
jgi:hypothetical protein